MLRVKIHSIIKFYLYPFFVEKPGFYRTWNLAHTLQVFGKDLSPTYSVNDVKFCQKNYLFQEEKRLFSPSSPLHPLIHTCMPVFPPILIKCSNIFCLKKVVHEYLKFIYHKELFILPYGSIILYGQYQCVHEKFHLWFSCKIIREG